ncbi:19S proteasome regulatory subunit [Schizosaccharomyces cryophilus OY26]|uniref:19S proteasome regulatory subunit n=1 Tax=Schizosaccharomyces cryophilus (strain OY26 / ATCC MYA-4695 / CBS 11777 / NBRC 106824 / NRRL Y48691) TaxID=653667 RepID=S9VQS9_SCHCR|nr:19S proteasome regulatory subunit [Schizosaccharomyces cryophilus OY26]EPY50288.1 19S proteasome regulatory subunit [Schizosaccharomyces cryophilus OY26]
MSLITFKAGKLRRIPGTKILRADPAKGFISMTRDADGLTHFQWGKRDEMDAPEDDIVVFPSECTFEKIEECPNDRGYMLKYPSSTLSLFYWMQDVDASNDQIYASRINSIIREQDYQESARSDVATVSDAMDMDTTEQNENITQSQTNQEQLPSSDAQDSHMNEASASETVRNLLNNISSQRSLTTVDLADVLKPSNVRELLSQEGAVDQLKPYLPPDTPATVEAVMEVLNSPQYAQALRSLSQTLNSPNGLEVISALGLSLDESASPSEVGALQFLKAIARQVKENEDRKQQ